MRLAQLTWAAAMLIGALPVIAQGDWAVVKTFHVGGAGGWDYLTVAPETHRLYVPAKYRTPW